MEFGGGVVESFKGKCILVTGATGFLAKIFVEKVLRVQPDVKKIYLLLRAPDGKTAAHRLQAEVTGKALFSVLKEKHGEVFDEFISEKISPIAGDISEEDLGIEDINLRELMWSEVNIVVNVAATTNFFERYDVALNINVLGAKHALEFAKKCSRIQLLLHVSTAYVAGSREGLVLEKRFEMGETLNDNLNLDIGREFCLMKETLKEQHDANSTKEEENSTMKQLGLDRARNFGWPNTYVFTKAMAEMLLGQMRGDLPIVIIRPTIITSVYNDPVPGWMEGIRTIDSLIVGYAKGNLPCFVAGLDLIMDTIPGDMVSNAMIVSIAAHSNQPCEYIYHVGSSVRNPVKYSNLLNCSVQYFRDNPQVGKDGKIIKAHNIPIFPTVESFKEYMNLRYKMPLEGLRFANFAFCHLFSQQYNRLNRKYNFVMRMADLYGPFSLFEGWFDDTNLEQLRMSLLKRNNLEAEMFMFDPKSIDWNNYLLQVHIPGVLKYVCK